jgi:septum formation protein
MLILASQSPRRRELLERAGLPFTVRVAGIEERRIDAESPESYVERLAREKALAVPAGDADWVLGADTTVVVDHHVLEKPDSPADARRMVSLLSGRWHEVMTGVCLRHGDRLSSAVETTRVHFLPLTAQEIDAYIASGEPMDKAGAYAIQGLAGKLIDRVEGCYFNVVGLPVARVNSLLKAAGYSPALE